MIYGRIVKLLHCYIPKRKSNNRKSRGFTLIELLVVVFFIALVTSFGISAFLNYSRSQAIQQATNDVSSLLTLAKSRALYQVKPDDTQFCKLNDPTGLSLDGYKFVLCSAGCIAPSGTADYEVEAICGGNRVLVQSKKLPPEISFDPGSTPFFFFPVLSGGVDKGGTITLTGYGSLSKVITIDVIGNIVLAR